MTPQQLHDFLFEMYDFADYLADQIEQGSDQSENYFVSLLFIESMMDSYGRMLIHQNVPTVSNGTESSLNQAHQKVDLLRNRIAAIQDKHDFDAVIKQNAYKMQLSWLRDKSGL